jgi:DNA modification methylase
MGITHRGLAFFNCGAARIAGGLPMSTPQLILIYSAVADIKPAERNPRAHSVDQIRQIADSIREFGFTNSILVDSDNTIVAGHGRLEAAKMIGLTKVPTVCIDHLTPAQLRAYAIADNKLAENAGWDRNLLALELEYIVKLDIDFDLSTTGFEAPEIDILLTDIRPADEDPADEVPEYGAEEPIVTRLGDLWQIGRHRIFCGDATKSDSYSQLLGSRKAQLVFIDPPYNVPIKGHVSGLGAVKHREFKMASGEMSRGAFTKFLRSTFTALAQHSTDGSIHFVCMDWRHILEIMTAGQAVYSDLKNLCVWNKNNGGMGSLYRSKHELIFVFKNGTAPHINNVELGRHGRYRTNVWDHPGASSLRDGRDQELAMHPTVKPVALVADAILDCSERDAIVLDCFGGSGTTIIAAERTGRHGHLIELDPAYVDVTLRRFEQAYGTTAIHVGSGNSLAQMAEFRAAEEPSDSPSEEMRNG